MGGNIPIFVALEQHKDISVQVCDTEFLGYNVINTVRKILIKKNNVVIFTILESCFGCEIAEKRVKFKDDATTYAFLENHIEKGNLELPKTMLESILNEIKFN